MDDRPENEIPNRSPEPMSLNQRLHHQLSRSRRPALAPNTNPNPIPENILVKQKDQLPGRRRLCKTNEEASPQKKEEDKEENISDILDEFSFRLESLSLHKEKPSKDERKKEKSPVEAYFSSKEGEEEGDFDDNFDEVDEYSFKVVPRNMKNRYFSDEESEMIDEGEEVAHKKSTVEYFSDEEELVEVEEFTKGEGEVGTEENDSIKSRNQGLEVKPSVYRSMGRTTKRSYFSDDDEVEEIENVTRVTGLQVNGFDPKDAEEEEEEEEEEGDFTLQGVQEGKVRVYKLSDWVYGKLYPHQREGINWLWGLHCKGTGGILGDDMGLGKTMQISAFLAGLFHSCLIKRAMIVAPKTLIGHWFKELSVVGLSEKARDFSGTNVNVRNSELSNILENGGILITTYDIVRNNYKAIRGGNEYQEHDLYEEEDEMIWDYVILDEGHIIKNPKTQRAQSLSEIPSAHRIIISGTPIQNNLKELWALFYFCCPEVLGDKDEFKDRYEKKILRGNEKNASDREKYVGSTVARELRERIKPYFLRRLKSEVFGKENVETKVEMPKKNELIVWLKLTPCQRQLYEAFLNSELVHNAVGGSPLAAITIMKKICDHPLLLTKRGAEEILEGIEEMNENDKGLVEKLATGLANQDHDNEFLNMDYTVSCKITFVLSLLGNLMEEGHVVLIFSQSRKMLDLIQEAIWSKGYKLLRIDGTTKISEREKTVKDFQDGEGAPIFLLTTQVGGLGLTLTKANRVIVIDPAWNPSMDNQSVDRAYRIGQTKDVIVYRLMTCGTIEEIIYKKQVFKGGLFKTATEQKEQTRYFSRKVGTIVDEYLTSHIEYLENQGIAGVSHHSLLFSKTAIVPVVPETSEQPESSFGNRIIRSSAPVASSQSEYFPYGAAYAQKPRDFIQNTRMESPTYQVGQSPGEIRDKINRLKITLGNKDLVAKLPDRGERMRNQLAELQLKLLGTSDSFPVNLSSEKKRAPEVISVDEIADNLDILSI
ncbi:DNA excision repair protein ERCC-6-like isoform X1 [Carex littledalei]|uniref:DNA excision repair protein ERCC-6-like isoform X1 n=1 Tax=Carex littledalei TaxID=544730 RepID=A0A833R8I9_9POAL|nr:DNA excision repair protein ERCC-6-like isoform X1 [Carex littledalei]